MPLHAAAPPLQQAPALWQLVGVQVQQQPLHGWQAEAVWHLPGQAKQAGQAGRQELTQQLASTVTVTGELAYNQLE
jgi:hypothetical protein